MCIRDSDAPVHENLQAIARSLDRQVEEITVTVLDRPRHEQLIADIRKAGARIQLIGDGDLSAARAHHRVDARAAHGGAPEGVLSAAALKCLNGEIQGRLKVDTNTASREKAEEMGVDFGRIYFTEDLCPGNQIVFAACGVTSGNLLQGVRHFGHGIRTQSLVLTYRDRKVHFIDTVHMKEGEKVTVRF
jgi:fructose-1,6-bisphosphatase II